MKNPEPFETLDPENWEKLRKLAHRMVDDAIGYIERVEDRPVWQSVPPDVAAEFSKPVPLEPTDPEQVYREFRKNIMPYPMGNIHPRFWAWYMGNGTVFGALGDFLAAIMNSNLGGGHHAAVYVEEQVVNWMKEMLGLPGDASGLLVSGGSMANLVGLTVARNSGAGHDIREQGVGSSTGPLNIYASKEVHSSVQKAVELLGLGLNSLRNIAVKEDYTIDLEQLAAVISADRAAGCLPVCVIGNAGTINTGAIDDLNALADLCRSEKIWFHVDGAIGAVAVLSERIKSRLSGIERADSVALDLHKWMHMPFEAGCVLIRNEEAHRKSFSLTPDYLAHETRGLPGGNLWFSDYGLQLSRNFRALKVWMSIKEHGLKKYGRMIDRNIEQAVYFGRLVENAPDLELLAPIVLDIVCFRFNPGGVGDAVLNTLNKEILILLQERAVAAPSYTTLNGIYCLRIAIANHRSRQEDFDLLAEAVVRIGRELLPGFLSDNAS